MPTKSPPSATIIDGIYTLERGPSIDGAPRRSDIVIASSNVLAADMIGAEVLGYDPADIRYLMQACQMAGFATDGSGIDAAVDLQVDLPAGGVDALTASAIKGKGAMRTFWLNGRRDG